MKYREKSPKYNWITLALIYNLLFVGNVYCTVYYNISYTYVYDIQCHVQCTLYNCTLYDVHCTVYDAHCTVYIVQCALYVHA